MARQPLERLLGGVTQFGSLLVIGERDGLPVPGNGAPRLLLCRCVCGNEKLYPLSNVKRGLSQSCGCQRPAKVRHARTSHGDSQRGRVAPEYRVWTHIVGRCCNPTDDAYSNYGGRGISMHPEWRESYAAFLADMGRRPSPAHSIDRIDVNGNYEPGNCRWALDAVQHRNRRNNRWIKHAGTTLCLSDWATKVGITRSTLECRLKRGWDLDRALSGPS